MKMDDDWGYPTFHETSIMFTEKISEDEWSSGGTIPQTLCAIMPEKSGVPVSPSLSKRLKPREIRCTDGEVTSAIHRGDLRQIMVDLKGF